MSSPAEIKAEYANNPLTIATELIDLYTENQRRPLTDIQTPANSYFAQLISYPGSLETTLRRFVAPIDIITMPRDAFKLIGNLMGQQSLALAALIVQNPENPEIYQFATSDATREKFRLLLNRAFLNDFAYLQREADEEGNQFDATKFQERANQMLNLRTKLMARANPTEQSPTQGQ